MAKFNKKPIGTEAHDIGSWFPFKQHRYNTANHPIVISVVANRSKLEFPVSKQEAQMLDGLATALQVDKQTALRIALYEGCKAPEQVELVLIRANPSTKIAGHTGRNSKTTIKLPATENKELKALAKALNISDKQAGRACLIMLARAVKSDKPEWRQLSGCKKLTQRELGAAWKEAKKEEGTWDNTKGSTLGNLRAANDEALDDASEYNQRLYERRGDKAKELVAQGLRAWVYPDDWFGRMDTSFVDEQIAMEEGELEDRYPELTEEEIEELEALEIEHLDLSYLDNTPPITLAAVDEPALSRINTPEYLEHKELMGKGSDEDTEKALRYFMGSDNYDRYLEQLNRG